MNTTELQQLGAGIECRVYKVNDYIVCKVYADRYCNHRPEPKQAEFAYRMQRIAHRAGLAPRALALENNQYYSERVECMSSEMSSKKWYSVKNSLKFKDLQERIDELFGGEVFDLHSGNIGYLSSGELCLIDFGAIGFLHTVLGQLLINKLGLIV